jgi:hypothetical protein
MKIIPKADRSFEALRHSKIFVSGLCGEHVADAADGVALCVAESEELEAVA